MGGLGEESLADSGPQSPDHSRNRVVRSPRFETKYRFGLATVHSFRFRYMFLEQAGVDNNTDGAHERVCDMRACTTAGIAVAHVAHAANQHPLAILEVLRTRVARWHSMWW